MYCPPTLNALFHYLLEYSRPRIYSTLPEPRRNPYRAALFSLPILNITVWMPLFFGP
ncbi:hypothetical protein BDD12DRAFT_821668 [Trichophaea hybrida]|nr:hypothetical protein BDD12DRAFT_821668 [Trichophaea hybrida]